MSIKKELIKRFVLGAPFGLLLTQLITVFSVMGHKTVTLDVDSYIVSVVASLILGGYLCAASIVYNVERWSIIRQTGIHLILMLPFFVVAYYLGWLPISLNGLLLYIAIWLSVYAVLWNIIRIYYKNEARKLNEGIKAYQSAR